MKLTLKNFWAYVVIGLAIFLGVVTLFDGYMDIKIDRKSSKPCDCSYGFLDPMVIESEEPNTYQDFLINALKTNRSPECNLLFDDCLGLMGIEK